MVERTALKLLPIMKELGIRLAGQKERKLFTSSSDDLKKDKLSKDGTPKSDDQQEKVDMRNILGHFNQNEWIMNLNIGDVIQIQPIRMKELLVSERNED